MKFGFTSSTLATGETVLGKAYSKDTFRAARYSQGSDNEIYIVKAFHVRRGIEATAQDSGIPQNDREFAEKCLRLFTLELAGRGFSNFELEYVNVYVGECVFPTHESLKFKQPPGTSLMIERLIPGKLKKWIKGGIVAINPDPDDFDSQVCSTFAHWSYESSGSSIIISDLQGGRIDEHRYVQVHPSQPPKVINHHCWRLNDPVVHFLSNDPSVVHLQIALKHDMNRDLGTRVLLRI